MDPMILHDIQPAHMSPIQNDDGVHETFSWVADVHDESTFNNIFIEGVDPFICCTNWKEWVWHPQADVFNIAFKAQM